jgi:predicted DNA-binding protein (MmcQ/YjbR family)
MYQNMDHKTVEEYVLSMPNARLDYPFGEDVAVYKAGSMDNAKMFALIPEGKDPVRISLKCDPELAKVLREKYETVLEGYHLNKKHWNTIILTGQLPWEEIQALIRHSYDLVVNNGNTTPAIK